MALMNLFSKPLDFNCTGSASENVAVLRDKSAAPVEFISKPLVIPQAGMLGNHLQRGVNTLKINDFSQHGCTKRKPNKSLKKKNKIPKYADHDGLLISCENRNSSMENWPGSNNKDALAPDHDSLGRPIICYEDPVFSPTKSKKQRSKQLKAAKKKSNNNNINNTDNKKKSKNKQSHMKNISQRASDNILSEAAPNYLSLEFSSSLKALEASCSIFDEPDSKSLKRKADDVDEGRSKSRRVYDEWTPIFDDKKLAVEATEVTKTKNMKYKEPLSKSKLRKIEKSKQFWEKRKEKETRDAAHQQGLQRKIVPCKFYVNGCCSKGTECTFSHDIPQVKKDEQCKFYVMSQCTKEGCLYRHGEWPCKFFHGQKGCRSNSCKFSHEPLTEITKKWLDKIFEGDSAITSENGEKEDKVEEFKGGCSTLERTIDSFYGSSANQTLPGMTQPKQEAEIHCDAGQPLNMNKIHDVSPWRCSGDLKSSNNSDIIRIEIPEKKHTSPFEFFKNEIESHRSNEFKDRCLYSPAEMVISKMPTHSSQNSIAPQPRIDSYRLNTFVKSFAQESVLSCSFKSPVNMQYFDKGLQGSIERNSDILFSLSSTMMVPEKNKHKSKGMMSSTTNANVSSPVIKPVLADNCRGSASLKASGISYTPFSTTKTAFYELKSNEITCSLVQHNEQIPQNKGNSGLFAASHLHDSMEMEFNYDKEDAKPIEKQRSLIKEPSATYEKIPTKNKELSTSPNRLALFSTLSFSFSETEATYVQSQSKLKNIDNSYVLNTLTNHPVINATLKSSSSTGCILQDDKANGLLPTPLSFSSLKAGVPCSATKLKSNKRAMLSKDDEASTINQKFPLNRQLPTKGYRLFSTPLSFSSSKTHLNNEKNELGCNGKVQKNEACDSVIITANPESSISLNDLGLFSKPLSFSSVKSDMTCGTNKAKSSKSVKDYLNCYSDVNNTFPTPSSAELNGLFSTPLSLSLMDADTSSNKNGNIPNGEVLNIKPTITLSQESPISSNNLKPFSTPLSFSTKTQNARDNGKRKSSKSVKDYLNCYSDLNSTFTTPSSAELNGLFSTPLSFSLMDADTSSNNNGNIPNGEVLNIKPTITLSQESPISSNNLKLFSTPLSFSTKTQNARDNGKRKSSKSVKDHLTCHSVLNNNLAIPSSKKLDGLSSIPYSLSSANTDMLPFSAIKTKSITSKSKSKKVADSLVSHPLICHSIINANLPIPTTTKVTGLTSMSLLSSSITDKSCNSNELELNNETSMVSQATVDQHLSAKALGLFSTPLSFTPVKTVPARDTKDLKSQDKLNSLNKKIMVSKTNKPISTKNKGTSELLSVPFSPPLMKTEPTCGTKKTLKSVKDDLGCDFGLIPTSRKVTGLFSNPLSFHPEIPSSTNESESIEKDTPPQVNGAMNQQLSAKAPVLFSTPLSFTATKSEMTCVTSKLSITNSLVSDPLTCHSIDANRQVPTTSTVTLFSTPLSFSSTKAEMSGIRNELKCNENVTPFHNHTTSAIGHSTVSTNQQIPASAKPLGLFATPLTFHLTNPESVFDTRELKSKDMTSLLAKDPLIFQPMIDANLQTPAEAFGFSPTEFKPERNEMKLKHQNQTLMPHAGSSNTQIGRNESATGLFLTPLSFPSSKGDLNP